MSDYGFEYSEDEMEEQDVDVENQYYNSKGLLDSEDGAEEALAGFQQVLSMDCEDRERWAFKALKQIVKARLRLGDADATLAAYADLLAAAAAPAIPRTAAEKKLSSTLDALSAGADAGLARRAYDLTLKELRARPNDRLWFKTSMKLATSLVDSAELPRALTVLEQLHHWCMGPPGTTAATGTGSKGGIGGSGTAATLAPAGSAPPPPQAEDPRRGTQALEVIALLIRVQTARGDTAALRTLCADAARVRSALPHPRILGIVRESGGHVALSARDWAAAATAFFEAFKSYDEAGAPERTRCLKYLVLAAMLMQSGVDPFDSQEARPYKEDPEVAAMTRLVDAYQGGDIREFESILRVHAASITDDPFIREHVDELRRNIRMQARWFKTVKTNKDNAQVVRTLVQSYVRVRLARVAEVLHCSGDEAERLLAAMLLDGQLSGSLDQELGVLELAGPESEPAARATALSAWADQLAAMQSTLAARLVVT